MPDAARQKFLQLARDRFKQAQEADKNQRQRELDDLRFYAGDQWPAELKTLRNGQDSQAGTPPVPARPCLTLMGPTREPIRQVLNQERQADMGIEIVPADDFGDLTGPIDDTEIQLREGLVRRIQRESSASNARTWAFARAVQAGVGYYAVFTRYVDGKTNDQEVFVDRIFNQSCVSLDPAHEQPDGSDCDFEFMRTDYRWSAYVAKFGKRNGKDNAACQWTDEDWRAKGDEQKDWFSGDNADGKDTRIVTVVDYFYTVSTSRELVTYAFVADPSQQRVEWTDEVPDPPEGWAEVPDSRRDVVNKTIKWAKIDGCDDDVLEETDWPSPYMPIVKVVGEELQPYDKERRVEGMIRPMREPVQGLNVMVSSWVERVAQQSLAPTMMAEGQDEGYEQEWDLSSSRALTRLHYKTTDLEGRPVQPPIVPPNRDARIDAFAASAQMFKEAVQESSGYHGPSLGKVDPSVKSGRAIKALQEQASQGSNHYLDNLKRSMEYEARIENSLLYPIYGMRPGRIARIVNGDGEAEHVIIGKPMIVQHGRPMPAPDGAQDATRYTLTKDARFNVAVNVSPQKDTRRQQENQTVGELIAQNPELMTWFGDLFFGTMDGPGHKQMAERAKVMLAPPIQQMLTAKQQGQDPQQAAALAQKDATIQQLQAQLQEAEKGTEKEKVKQQGETERHELQLESDAHKLAVESETKIAVAELGAKVDRLTLFLEERARIGVQDEAARARDHEIGMAARGDAVAADAASAQRAHEASESAAGRQAARESQAQAEAAAAAEGEAARQAAAQQAAQG